MATGIIIIPIDSTNPIEFNPGSGTWVNSVFNPGSKICFAPPIEMPALPPINISVVLGNATRYLLYGASLSEFIGIYSLANLPDGFVVSNAHFGAQFVNKNAIPGPEYVGDTINKIFPIGTEDVIGGKNFGSCWDDWNCGGLPLEFGDPTEYDPSMTLQFLGGLTFTATGVLNPGENAAAIFASTDLWIDNGGGPVTWYPPIAFFNDPVDAPRRPINFWYGFWSTETAASCPVIGSVTDIIVVDPDTGEISWTLPAIADAVVIEITSGSTTTTVMLDDSVTNYTPTLSGALSIRLKGITATPICSGPFSASVEIFVLTPLVITMSGGIDLGGSPTLQFIGDPSGIYTLIPNQYRDILYERIPAPAVNPVKIPKPFAKTAFLGD